MSSVRTDGIARMEIRVMGNNHLTVGADLKVEFKGIYAHIQSMLHCLYGIFRHKTCSTSVSLNVDIVRHVHIIDPFLSEAALYRDGDILSILARSSGKIMVIWLGGTIL